MWHNSCTHVPPHRHTCIRDLDLYCFKKWRQCLKQRWFIVKWTLKNKINWNVNQNTKPFIQENTFENVVSKISILFPVRQPAVVPPSHINTTYTKSYTIYLHSEVRKAKCQETNTIIYIINRCLAEMLYNRKMCNYGQSGLEMADQDLLFWNINSSPPSAHICVSELSQHWFR